MARKSAVSSAGSTSVHPPTTNTANDTPTLPDLTNTTTTFHSRLRSPPHDPSLLPTGSRSLSSISLQAFALGLTLSTTLLTTAYLSLHHHPLWRIPAFIACLSLFHFLEFWTTAYFNCPAARADSFLLFSNGVAYNIAHSLATLEMLVSALFLPGYQQRFVHPVTIAVGLMMVVVGQLVRTTAMAHAGTNFNHTPAKTKVEGHVLVTTGIYRCLRHPSYFGFFWWAVGTQVLVGNKICLLGYLVALWRFFYVRIKGEEVNLVKFFGEDYEAYRRRTGTGIPFIP